MVDGPPSTPLPSTTRRIPLDVTAYEETARHSDCFICKIIDGTSDFPHVIVYRDDKAIAFLNRYPTLLGYCLVAPIEHREAVVDDFPRDDYLSLQTVVHSVGRAVSACVPTERLYILSLGSNQGNAHVHWHLAPLPPGVPYQEQQFRALMVETDGYLDLSAEDQSRLGESIIAHLSAQPSMPDVRNF